MLHAKKQPPPVATLAALQDRGTISQSERMAGEALRLVLIGDQPSNGRHHLNAARECVDDQKAFDALAQFLRGTASIESIGQEWTGHRQSKQAYASGASLIKSALSRLSRSWL